jgi:hypothetical protein
MAVTAAGELVQMAAQGDTLSTIVRPRIARIHIISGATGGAVLLTANGFTYWSNTVATSSTSEIDLSTPLDVDSFVATTLPATCTILVQLA